MSTEGISRDLIRGLIDVIILKILLQGDCYGYEIIKKVFELSGGRYELKEPSLYTCLKRMEKQKMIESYWGNESQGARRKYYRLTESGRENLEQSVGEWIYAQETINLILLGGNKG